MPDESVATKTLERLNTASAARLQEMQRRLSEYVELARRAQLTITTATKDYRETGVAFVDPLLRHAFTLFDASALAPKHYFQALAKEHERPLLYAEDLQMQGYIGGKYRHIDLVQLTIPASSRLRGATAGLSLVASPGPVYEHPVTTAHSDRLWRFNFVGDDGMAVFHEFRNTCRTNRTMRVMLKLGPLTHEVTTKCEDGDKQ